MQRMRPIKGAKCSTNVGCAKEQRNDRKKTAKENVTFPNPTPLPVTGSHLNPGMDPVLAANVLLNDLRMQRIDREIANGALDWLSRHNGIDAQELIRRSADHQSPVYGNPIATDADQLDLLVTSTIDNERWPTALPLQARAADQFFNANLEVKRKLIRTTAHRMGLTVTSETGGTHTKNSLHYRGLAIDVAFRSKWKQPISAGARLPSPCRCYKAECSIPRQATFP
jgi:hypothetical protein